MKISEITIIQIDGILQIRENKKKVGNIKKIGENLKLKYHNKTVKIKERPSVKGLTIEINDETYQFLEHEVRKLPTKEKLFIVKFKYGKIYFVNSKKEKIMEVKFFGNIVKLKFFQQPSDIILYMISGLHYLVKK